MKLKTLLLGSAAALIAVTGARAADAVVADPEPVDYVRVCDMYGAGFYYIPGTETCISINGYARVEYIYTKADVAATSTTAPSVIAGGATFAANNTAITAAGNTIVQAATATAPGLALVTTTTPARSSTGDWRYRGRLNFDVRNETDWGTLRSQLRFQGDGNGGGDGNVGIDRALISVGGLQFGYSDAFFTTHHGYGWQKAANDGYYSYDQAIMLQYTYSGNGFSATVGIQDSVGPAAAAGNGSENVDIYGGASYAGSWGRVAGSVISDGFSDDLAWKISANISVIENLGINGWYANDDGKTRFVNGYSASGTTEQEWGVDVNYQVTDMLNVWVGYTAYDTTTSEEAHRYAIGAIWNPIPGLSFRPEVLFGENTSAANVDTDYSQFRLRVVRSW